MRKFTEVLEEYLDLRERLNSEYYENKYLGLYVSDRKVLRELADELDVMIEQKELE